MDAIELLLSRDSARLLAAPGPNADELDLMYRSALRAPDHGRLRPWHFLTVPTDQRERFGDVLADSMRRREPTATPELLQRERDKAMRAPVIVVAVARLNKGHRIPEIEQIASAAAATQNIMLAAHAMGYGAMWKTGAPAYDAGVKQALGLNPDDEIMGFLYLGTRTGEPPITPPRPTPETHVSTWHG